MKTKKIIPQAVLEKLKTPELRLINYLIGRTFKTLLKKSKIVPIDSNEIAN